MDVKQDSILETELEVLKTQQSELPAMMLLDAMNAECNDRACELAVEWEKQTTAVDCKSLSFPQMC